MYCPYERYGRPGSSSFVVDYRIALFDRVSNLVPVFYTITWIDCSQQARIATLAYVPQKCANLLLLLFLFLLPQLLNRCSANHSTSHSTKMTTAELNTDTGYQFFLDHVQDHVLITINTELFSTANPSVYRKSKRQTPEKR